MQFKLNFQIARSDPNFPWRDCTLPSHSRGLAEERFPIKWNPGIEKESLIVKELEHVLIEIAGQLFGIMS